MAPQKKTRKGKKKWCDVLAPKEFNNAVLGESYVYEIEDLVGKTVKANLMTLTNDIKKQSMIVTFRVTQADHGKALTEATGFYVVPGMIKRLVRRGRDKVEDSFLVKTKDGKYARIKPLVVTTNNTEKATQSALRKKVRILLRKYASDKTFSDMLMDIVNNNLAKQMKNDCKVLYPLRSVTIRTFEEVHLRHEVEIPVDSDDTVVVDEDEVYEDDEPAPVAHDKEEKEEIEEETAEQDKEIEIDEEETQEEESDEEQEQTEEEEKKE